MSEIDSAARSVLTHHYPETKLYGDFTEIPDDAGPIDVLVGGTPCQSFSVAGLRGGMDDARGNLALEFCRLADRLRPRWIVWENVPGVLSSNGGRDFGSILGAMGELGYGTAYRILDAQYVGVPQRRRRVFVVGYFGDWRRAAAVLFERHGLSGHLAPRRETGQGVTYELAPSLTSSGRGVERTGESRGQDPVIACTLTGGSNTARNHGKRSGSDRDTLVAFSSTGDGYWQEGAGTLRARTPHEHIVASTGQTSHCLNAGGMGRIDYETETLVTHALRADGFDASEDGSGRGTPLIPVAFSCKDHGADAGELSPTLRAMEFDGSHANGGGQVAVAFNLRGREGGAMPEVSNTASLRAASGGSSRSYVAQVAVRRLTPLECCRLQGFPDDYFRGVLHRGKPLADGPIYKMLGNSMAVPCMAWIGKQIQAVESIT